MSEPRYVQHVAPGAAAAQGPYATATVHHHYGSRLPTIEPLPPPATPDTAWLMAQPSRLLDARSHVVPFTGRTAELERLRQWRDARDARLSVLLLHAPGGEGKTRLATEFAEHSRSPDLPATGRWQVLQAGFRDAAPTPGPTAATPEEGAGVLLVVDYAVRWAHCELQRLLSEPELHRQRPTRILLIGRTVRWFAALRGELAERRAAGADLLLPSLDTDRLRMFTAARDRYAASDLYDLPGAASAAPPASLDRSPFGLTLNLHMAALVSVDAHARGERPSLAEPHDLSAYLLDREYWSWQKLFDAGSLGQDYRTRPAVMAKTVFTAALTGAVGHATGVQALRTLDLPGHPLDLLLDHRFCYPPADRELVLEPLYPDRLAEDFLGLLTPGHDISAYDPDPWASGVPAALLGGDLGPAVAPRAVTFLASAAARWGHVGERVLYPLLRSAPALAIAAGSPALTTLAALADAGDGAGGGIDPDLLTVLEAVESHLPPGRHADLDGGILAVVETLIAHRLAATADPGRRAALYATLAWRRANAGRREQAVAPAEEAVRLHRELAADDPGHLPHLANSLGALGDRLAAAGRWEEALFEAEEAAATSRRLADADPDAQRHHFAMSLANLGIALRAAGRSEEGLEVTEVATDLYRQLADANPDAHQPDLTAALVNLGAFLADLGRGDEALAQAEEAVVIQRRLADTDFAAHCLDLAKVLNNLGTLLLALGHEERALDVTREAAELYERLALAHPTVDLPEHADVRSRLAQDPSDVREEALAATREATELYRLLAETTSGVELGEHAASLGRVSQTLARLGRFEEAVTAAERAATHHLDAGDRRRAAELLLMSAQAMSGLRSSGHAAALFGRAAQHFRRTGDRALEGTALTNLGSALAAEGRGDEAVTACERAVAVFGSGGGRVFEIAALTNLS
ncbi:tetratricopeptide repeat protein, partial [Streptomyces sp. NPDC058728]|uniref:tetratricopeptide repeat protein n=1 Tax=Streptomyces sp. NPDC058728 TaxID=3346612 RepID=UPI0036C11E45